MAMLTTLKSLVGDAFSGPVKDQRISLSQEQAAILERELVKSHAEISSLTIRVSELESENANFQAKLAQYEQRDEGLNEKEEQVLRFFFDAARELSSEDVVSGLGFKKAIVDHYILDLLDMNFIVYLDVMLNEPLAFFAAE